LTAVVAGVKIIALAHSCSTGRIQLTRTETGTDIGIKERASLVASFTLEAILTSADGRAIGHRACARTGTTAHVTIGVKRAFQFTLVTLVLIITSTDSISTTVQPTSTTTTTNQVVVDRALLTGSAHSRLHVEIARTSRATRSVIITGSSIAITDSLVVLFGTLSLAIAHLAVVLRASQVASLANETFIASTAHRSTIF
jgi:hypothetical protein